MVDGWRAVLFRKRASLSSPKAASVDDHDAAASKIKNKKKTHRTMTMMDYLTTKTTITTYKTNMYLKLVCKNRPPVGCQEKQKPVLATNETFDFGGRWREYSFGQVGYMLRHTCFLETPHSTQEPRYLPSATSLFFSETHKIHFLDINNNSITLAVNLEKGNSQKKSSLGSHQVINFPNLYNLELGYPHRHHEIESNRLSS